MLRPRSLKVVLLFYFVSNCWFLAATPDVAKASDLEVLYLFTERDSSQIPEHLQLAADALGVEIISVSCEKAPDQKILERIAGVVVSTEVALVEPECLRVLLMKLPKATPVLFPGLRRMHQEPLRLLGLPITIETDIVPSLNPHEIVVHPVPLASFFGGLRLPFRANDGLRLALPGSQTIIGFGDSNEAVHYLVQKSESCREFFLLAGTQLILEKPLLAADNLLLQALPYFIFFARAGGDRIWQGSGFFANLTIDDPFLVEPYGSLSFEKLLRQMDAHGFHTTIGFIPWNFDRNEKNTVALFKSRPDRFSISVHGNNHDRKEFYRYSSKALVEPFATKTLREHEFNLAQALVRMNEFSRVTGIPYDPVMIFPQEISPAPTLRFCEQLGYIATVNQSNIPLDSELPRRIQMSFRPYNSFFYSFASFRRVHVNYYSELRIRADLFLGNPLFLYSHHNLFESSIESFNSIADLINNLYPTIEWASLGKIISQWYLWRRTLNNTFEVRMLSPVCVIVNNGTDVKQYEISKEEDSTVKILSIMVNGEPISWKREPDRVKFRLDLPPRSSGRVVIQYSIDVISGTIGLYENTSFMVFLWRSLAEFRDRVLSRFLIGRLGRDFLYESGLSIWIPMLFITLVVIAIAGVLLFRFRKASSIKKES